MPSCFRLPVDGHQAQGPGFGRHVGALNQGSLTKAGHRFETDGGFALQGTDVFDFKLNRGRITHFHEEA